MKQFAWPVKSSIWVLAVLLASGAFAQEKQTEATEKPAPASTEKPAQLPAAEQVLKRYIKAVGGEKAFADYQSQHATGSISMGGQQMNGKMEVFAARPNKLLVIMEMPGVGKITTGFDGKVGWMSNPLTGPMLLPDSMLDQISTQADFDHALRKPEDYKSIEMLGLESFAGEPCYKLKLVHRSGFESTEYFSKETGLQKGFVSKQSSPLGEVNVTTEVTDYKKFGDVLMPSRTVQKVSGLEQVLTIDEMEFNTVPASKFELPPDIQALADPEPDTTREKNKEP